MNYRLFLLHIDPLFSLRVLPGPRILHTFANLSTYCMPGKHFSVSYVLADKDCVLSLVFLDMSGKDNFSICDDRIHLEHQQRILYLTTFYVSSHTGL